jgi:hypothetical protein
MAMSHPNTAFFHPQQPVVRVGIRAEELYEPSSQEIRQGVLLGSAEQIRARENGRLYPTKRARKGAQVVWTHDGNPLPTTDRSLLTHASIVDVPTERGGIRHLLSASRDDGKHLVFVQTGLTGRLEDHVRQVLENAHGGKLPRLHGSVAIDDGSRAVSNAEEGELPITASIIPPRRLRWWRPRTILPGTDSIRARVMDLWELAPGAELLVRDIFPGHSFRIVIRDGKVEAVDAPTHADDLFEHARERKPKALMELEPA